MGPFADRLQGLTRELAWPVADATIDHIEQKPTED
jgi:hypothetical protein